MRKSLVALSFVLLFPLSAICNELPYHSKKVLTEQRQKELIALIANFFTAEELSLLNQLRSAKGHKPIVPTTAAEATDSTDSQ